MKSIDTLIPDIYDLVQIRGGWFDAISSEFGLSVSNRLMGQFGLQKEPALRLSQMGPRCPKALWHSIHTPTEAELLPPWAEVKYAYGHIIEALVIALAKASGHHVCGEQDELRVDDILGHRDCVIDGCLVDVKSSSSYGMAKFKDGSIREDDAFGYLDQLDGYLIGSMDDDLVQVKDRAYLLAVDKQLGHMVKYEHVHTPARKIRLLERIGEYKNIVNQSKAPPCRCGTQSDGKSGNIALDTKASYSNFKFSCFPNLRVFIPKSGSREKSPKYLTHIVRVPDMLEIDRYGNVIG